MGHSLETIRVRVRVRTFTWRRVEIKMKSRIIDENVTYNNPKATAERMQNESSDHNFVAVRYFLPSVRQKMMKG